MSSTTPPSVPRRKVIASLGLLGAAPLVSCGSESSTALSSNAALSALTLSTGTLSPTFAADTTSYSVTVANTVTSLTVTPVVSDSGATVTVNGVTVASGSASAAIALSVGTNAITVVVTAPSGSTRAYVVTATRQAAALSNDASLSALALSQGALTPAFAAATTAYTVAVANTITSITITPTAAQSAARITVNGTVVTSGTASAGITLPVGTTTIPVVVTAPDGATTRQYSIAVTRASVVGTTCVVVPSETVGPYPLLSILSNSILRRQDIRENRTGVPLTLVMNLVDVSNSCAPITNAAVYIWHCDKDGQYSGYSGGSNGNNADATWLRGVQTTNSAGQVSFQTIYPGWYAGRITHIHFQVYLNNNLSASVTATSQLAFPQATTAEVYASTLYASRGQNTSVRSFAEDNVFSDGTEFQLTTVTGSVSAGYTSSITVGVRT